LPPSEPERPGPDAAPPDAPPDAPIGPTTIGRYRILGKLGEGGMGIVYEAEQQEPRRRVALKVVRGGELLDETRVRFFLREAEALARLKHPGIAAIYEAGRTAGGQHYFAMELVRGASLADWLSKRPAPATRAEVQQRLRLFCAICEAVHYAHQRGVIHRDLKPSNVLVSEEPAAGPAAVKVLDFGLARITEDSPPVTVSADAGIIRGTLQYMSPEQARGSPDAIDVRTDVYSLGVMLYELVSGRRPYELERVGVSEALRVIC
jgi:serine/threonine protein kinase